MAALEPINMLVDISDSGQADSAWLQGAELAPWRRAVIERVLGSFTVGDLRSLVAEIEEAASLQRLTL